MTAKAKVATDIAKLTEVLQQLVDSNKAVPAQELDRLSTAINNLANSDKAVNAHEKAVAAQERAAAAQEFGDTYSSLTLQAGSSAPSGSAGPPQLQNIVTQAIQGVLGRSFKQGDHRSFRAALEVSFEYREAGGRRSYEWKPRAYPSVGATDIGGGISGAQYSLVSFATSLHQTADPLIDNLQSLDTSVDDEEFEAAKALFETTWDAFVDELSREGGPRASRANQLARSIFDPTKPNDGHLHFLGTRLGMIASVTSTTDPNTLLGTINFDRTGVVTSEEEGYLTSFITLTDYYFAVVRAWESYRSTFLKKDLGSGLLLIERALAVVEEGVNELYAAMDSVNVEQSERLVIPIGFAAPDDGLTIEDFLSWISSFASTEAPELIREGGRRGVAAIIPTARKLDALLTSFSGLIKSPPPPQGSLLPAQFRHARVLNPLDELGRYLRALVLQAEAII